MTLPLPDHAAQLGNIDCYKRLLAERTGASKTRVIDGISSIAFTEAGLGLMVNRQEASGPGGRPVSRHTATRCLSRIRLPAADDEEPVSLTPSVALAHTLEPAGRNRPGRLLAATGNCTDLAAYRPDAPDPSRSCASSPLLRRPERGSPHQPCPRQ